MPTPGLDVRGGGGYVIAPGAVNGKGAYSDHLMPDLPVWSERGLRLAPVKPLGPPLVSARGFPST